MSANDAALGYIFGHTFGGNLRSERDIPAEEAQVRKKLEQLARQEISDCAQRLAVVSCIEATLEELDAINKGHGATPRHSALWDASGRAEDFVDTAVSNLRRLSKGRLTYTRESMQNIKEAGLDVSRAINTDYMKLVVATVDGSQKG